MKVNLQAVHPSLLMHKLGLHSLLFDAQDCSKLEIAKPENNGYVGDKRYVLDALLKSVQDDNFRNIYSSFYNQNWLEYLNSINALTLEAKTGSRFISGLSYGAAMHVGFSLHHTYGVPYIPGSTVKGACKSVAQQEALEMKGEIQAAENKIISQIYGDDNDNNGQVIFLDAFPVPLAKKTSFLLELEVVTPHHVKANAEECGFETYPDIEEPVPVEFAVVPQGIAFNFAFICPDKQYAEMVTRHWELACDEGFGAKISSGYGYFIHQKPDSAGQKSPQALFEEFKKKVESNKTQLINMLSGFVDDMNKDFIPDDLKKEMATLLVKNFGPKNLKKRIKKGSKAAQEIERLWKS